MKEKRHPLEWIVLTVSALVVATLFVYLSFMAARQQRVGEMPVLELSCARAEASPDGQFRVAVKIKKRGLGTAEHLTGEAVLRGGSQPETVEFQLDRLASEASLVLYVLFQEDPGQPGRKVQARITGFQLP